jgi:ketosteroid isomerase-like protein
VDAPELPGATTWKGHEGILACWTSWTGVWGEVSMEPIEYIEAGAGVYLMPQMMRASGAASGTPIEMRLWSVARFKDGKVCRVTFHVNEDDARRAAGLIS